MFKEGLDEEYNNLLNVFIDKYDNCSRNILTYGDSRILRDIDSLFNIDAYPIWNNTYCITKCRKITMDIEEYAGFIPNLTLPDYRIYIVSYLLSKYKKYWSIIGANFEAEYGNNIQYIHDKLLERKNLLFVMSPEQFSVYQKAVCIFKNNGSGRKRLLQLFTENHQSIKNYILKNSIYVRDKELLIKKNDLNNLADVICDASWILSTYQNVLIHSLDKKTFLYEKVLEEYIAGMIILEENGYTVNRDKEIFIEYHTLLKFVFNSNIKKNMAKEIFDKIANFAYLSGNEMSDFLVNISIFKENVKSAETAYEMDTFYRLRTINKEMLLIILENFSQNYKKNTLFNNEDDSYFDTCIDAVDEYFSRLNDKIKITTAIRKKAEEIFMFSREFIQYASIYFSVQDIAILTKSIIKKPSVNIKPKEIVTIKEIHLDKKERDNYEKAKKSYMKEISDLNKTVNSLKQQIKTTNEEKQELAILREKFYNTTIDMEAETKKTDIEECAKKLDKNIKGIIVGGHTNTQHYMQEKLPSWKMIPEDFLQIKPEVIRNADVIAIFTCHMGHSLYTKVCNIVKSNTSKNIQIIRLNSSGIENAIKTIFEEVTIPV